MLCWVLGSSMPHHSGSGIQGHIANQPESEDNTKAHKNVTMALPVTSQLDPTSAVDIPIRFYGIHLFILFIRNTTMRCCWC